jgi:hypothetical protein
MEQSITELMNIAVATTDCSVRVVTLGCTRYLLDWTIDRITIDYELSGTMHLPNNSALEAVASSINTLSQDTVNVPVLWSRLLEMQRIVFSYYNVAGDYSESGFSPQTFSEALTSVANCLSVAGQEGVEASMITIDAILFHPYASQSVLPDSIKATGLNMLANLYHDSSLDEDTRIDAGGILFKNCLQNPLTFFNLPGISNAFNLDYQTLERMIGEPDQSFDWAVLPPELEDDGKTIAMFAIRCPDEQIVRTIFEDTNLTRFGMVPDDWLLHTYHNRTTLTGRPLFLISIPRHDWNGAFWRFLKIQVMNNPEISLDNFDIRVIEPRYNTNFGPLLRRNAARLGIQSNSITAEGPKFRFFELAGHGSPESIGLIRTGSSQRPPRRALDDQPPPPEYRTDASRYRCF